MYKMNAAVYARVSTAAQAEKGYSLETQIEACRQKALSLGATSIKEYVDDGYSGAFLERPALDSLRDALSAKIHDTVIIYDTDRLARDTMLLLLLTEEIEKTAKLYYVNTEYSHTPEGQLFYEIKGSFAKYERIRIQDRFSRGRRGKLKSGKPLKEYKILGYDFVDGQYVINPAEAEIVKLIYNLYLETNGGHAKIADILYERGILSLGGKKFHSGTIYGILNHSHYTGKYYSYQRYHKKTGANTSKFFDRDESEWIEMTCPQIIPLETWEAVQKKLQKNKVKRIREGKYKNLFQGIMYCGICGRKISFENFSGYPYYTCAANKKKTGTCLNRYARADVVDKTIWEAFCKICESEASVRRYLKQPKKKENNAESIRKKLSNLSAQRTAVMNWFSNSLITMEECTAKLESLKKQEINLNRQLTEEQTETKIDPAEIVRDVKNAVNYEDKRRTVLKYISKITLVRKGEKRKQNYDLEFHIEF